ncbi:MULTISPECIES: GAF and ANTAR domain-containing protein [Streptomyces]|uniref:GAF and ANTAR domain-containing protein n=1 Tax=Streptomyces TaxID=1883 RepID=UPI000B095CE3|nr:MULTISPECIES: GAF and ANTAR domain-containing protein [Streptomyces]
MCQRSGKNKGRTAPGFDGVRLVHAAARKRDRARLPQRLCAALCRGLPVEEVSLCLSTSPTSQQVLGTCGAAALCLEEVQFETGEGPGTDAATTGRPVLYPDLRTQPMPYPFFAPRLQEEAAHVAAVYAFPLSLGTHTFGTAQCVRFDPLCLNALALAQAAAAMDAAAGLVADFCLPHFAADDTLPWEPAETIDAHWGTTYRATGVLAGILDTSVADALARLRALAFATGRPLPALAHDILHNRRPTAGGDD